MNLMNLKKLMLIIIKKLMKESQSKNKILDNLNTIFCRMSKMNLRILKKIKLKWMNKNKKDPPYNLT